MSDLVPYRSAEIVINPSKPLFGLIKTPKPPPKHKCFLPSFLERIWHGIRIGSLYRCPTCGGVWEMKENAHDFFIWYYAGWRQVNINLWLKAGGQLEENAKDPLIDDDNTDEDEDEDEDEDDE